MAAATAITFTVENLYATSIVQTLDLQIPTNYLIYTPYRNISGYDPTATNVSYTNSFTQSGFTTRNYGIDGLRDVINGMDAITDVNAWRGVFGTNALWGWTIVGSRTNSADAYTLYESLPPGHKSG